MLNRELYNALKTIERHDPDGGEVEPTETAYSAFEYWAVHRFGQEVWAKYREGGWDTGCSLYE